MIVGYPSEEMTCCLSEIQTTNVSQGQDGEKAQSDMLLYKCMAQAINTDEAVTLGIRFAVIVSQIRYQCSLNEKRERFCFNGNAWCKNSIERWQKYHFPFWSLATVTRLFSKMTEERILIRSNEFNRGAFDKGYWYCVNEDLIAARVRLESTQPRKIYLYDPMLAKSIGLKEALFLQQIHFWVLHNRIRGMNEKNRGTWSYNSAVAWQWEYFPFLSLSTMKRVIKHLEDLKLIESGIFNNKKWDRTKWYRPNYPLIEKLSRGQLRYDKSSGLLISNANRFPRRLQQTLFIDTNKHESRRKDYE